MESSLHNYFKVGIVNFMAFPGQYPVVDAVTKIATDPFFGAIEITRVPNAEDRAKVAGILAASKLEVGFAAQPVILGGKRDLNSLDESVRAAAVQEMKACIDEAYAVGATRFAVLSGPDPGVERRQEATAALVRSISEILDYARSKGKIGFALEVFDREIDKKALIGSTADAVAVSKMVRERYPEFGLMIDLSHLPLQGETIRDSLHTAKDHIIHIHIGNCSLVAGDPMYGDLHPRFGIKGGENDVPEVREFLRTLLEIGYIGPGKQNIVAFEVKPMTAEETPDLVIANAKRTLMEAWAGV